MLATDEEAQMRSDTEAAGREGSVRKDEHGERDDEVERKEKTLGVENECSPQTIFRPLD